MKPIIAIFSLILAACASIEEHEPESDSSKIFETLSTSPEFKDTTILLCIDKDCLSIDRQEVKKGNNRKNSK